MFCKNFVNFIGKHLCWCLFLTSCRSLACNLFKKRLQHRYFPLRFAKHLRTSMCVRLLLFFAKKNSTWSERRTFSVKFRAKILNICNKDIERGRCRVKNNKIEQKFIFFFLVQKQANLLQSSKNFPSYFFFISVNQHSPTINEQKGLKFIDFCYIALCYLDADRCTSKIFLPGFLRRKYCLKL